VQLPNRIVMAPLTRAWADEYGVPSDLAAEYYTQRAGAGLIIAEATAVSRQGTGYDNWPGLYTAAQEAGWRKITKPAAPRASAPAWSRPAAGKAGAW
jgi:2,4-dienoyl-CoA reductase-like NADH-dependent reductase (Old Yellow Enzyme family)